MDPSQFGEWMDMVKGCSKRAQVAMGGIGAFLGVLTFTLLTYYVQKRDLSAQVQTADANLQATEARLNGLYSENAIFLDATYTEQYLKKWLVVLPQIKQSAIANPTMVSDAQEVYGCLETYEGLINAGIGKKRVTPSYAGLDDKDKESLLRLCALDWSVSHGAVASKIEAVRRYLWRRSLGLPIQSVSGPDSSVPFHSYLESLGDKPLLTSLFAPEGAFGRFVRNTTGRELNQQLQEPFYENLRAQQTTLQSNLNDLKTSTIKVPVVDLNIPLVLAAGVALALNLAFLGYVYIITVRFAVCVANALGVATPPEADRLRVAMSDFPLLGKPGLKSDLSYTVWLAGPTIISVAYPLITGEGFDARLSAHMLWAFLASLTIFCIALLLRRAAQDIALSAKVPHRFLAIEACAVIRDRSKRRVWPQDFVADFKEWPHGCPSSCDCLKTRAVNTIDEVETAAADTP